MLEVDSVSSSLTPSIWDSMNSWLTPTVLFLLLNLMIATIALTSSLSNTPKNNTQTPDNTKSPSSVLHRLRSINLSPYRSMPSVPDSHQTDNNNPPVERTLDEVFSEMEVRHVTRTRSDSEPIAEKLPARMRKSASMKSAFSHFEEGDVVKAVETRRPATVREGKARVTEGDDEVDAKADDFINRFKNQLKLQRMDSIVRYKEMIGRGAAN